jgi:methionine synthase II (cobalamin-independent)
MPRPSKLQEAYAQYDAGDIGKEDLETLQEAAVKDTIERSEATGAPIISDGEQRWSSFATYPIADTLAGTGLSPGLGNCPSWSTARSSTTSTRRMRCASRSRSPASR